MAISCLGFNTIALFSRQIFKIDDALVNASLIFWLSFAEMICSVPRNSPMGDYQNISLTDKHSEPIGTIRTPPTQKSPPSVQAVFQVAPAPISSRFLCPRPPLLLSPPNQNRHATQVTWELVFQFGAGCFRSQKSVTIRRNTKKKQDKNALWQKKMSICIFDGWR